MLKHIVGIVAVDSSDSEPAFFIFQVSQILGSRAKQWEVLQSRWELSSSLYWGKVEPVCHNVYPRVRHTSYLPLPEFWPEFCLEWTGTCCCFIQVASLEAIWHISTTHNYWWHSRTSIRESKTTTRTTLNLKWLSCDRRREVPNLEILDTNIAFQIGVDVFLCPASHPKLGINPNWYFNPNITPKSVRNT
jgi:hypothetical protein